MDFTPKAAMAALALLVSGTSQEQASVKIAYVNTSALMENAPGRDVAQKKYNDFAAQLSKDYTKMQDSFKVLVDKYQADLPKLTTEALKAPRLKVLNDYQAAMTTKQDEFEGLLAQKNDELLAPIQDIVKTVLDELRTEGGFAIIFANVPGASPIAAADKNLDLTERALSRLKTKAPPAALAPANKTVTRPTGRGNDTT